MDKSEKSELISSKLKGRDLDRAVHQFVMNEKLYSRVPYYSDEMNSAWKVVYQMIDLGYMVKMVHEGVHYHMKFYKGMSKDVPFSSWPIPAEVICYAALAALERDGKKRK